jgi:epoxyqueuosine reductase
MLKHNDTDFTLLAENIKHWGKSLGFQDVRITTCDNTIAFKHLQTWIQNKFHGEMRYMENNLSLRQQPEELHPGTVRIISVRLDYMSSVDLGQKTLNNNNKAYVSQYALGRDYHKVLRKKLKQLGEKINQQVPHHYRAFTDSAPILERAYAEQAGLGWIGKNTMLINQKAGSYFFLGELLTNIPLPIDQPTNQTHCGSCRACIDICPTQAIVAPYQLDARRCISYLNIEYKGSIPLEFRKKIGNRIVGCDDCQLICPWNKFTKITEEHDFLPRHELNSSDLMTLFAWTEKDFLQKTEGSAIRRLGYISWLRNIAIALGNAPYSEEIVQALLSRQEHLNPLVREHASWALAQQQDKHK